MTGGQIEDAGAMFHPAPLRIRGTINQPPQPGEANCGGTHRARLEGDVKIKTIKAFRPQSLGSRTNHQHLGVSSRIAQLDDAITGHRHSLARVRVHQDCPHRHLAAPGCRFCLGQTLLHVWARLMHKQKAACSKG